VTIVSILLYDWVVDPERENFYELVGKVKEESDKAYKWSGYSRIMSGRVELPDKVESVPFLTTKVLQMWWSKAAWRRIVKEGHGFIWAEASRSMLTTQRGRETLSCDGVVYKSVEF
jgi:hypothetical protein